MTSPATYPVGAGPQGQFGAPELPSPHAATTASPFRTVFAPSRIFLGLGLIVAGLLVIAFIFTFLQRIKLLDLLWGPFLLVAGGAAIYSAWSRGCSRCKATLEETRTVFPLEAAPHLHNALGWVGQNNVEGLMQLQYLAVQSAPRRAAVLVHFCPECRSVAELQTATAVVQPDGTNSSENLSNKVPLVGPGVQRVLTMIGERNQAIDRAIYGGQLPR